MKLSCMSLMIPGATLTEQAEKAKIWGFDGIAVFLNYSDWNDRLFNEVETLQQKTGIIPCEFILMDSLYGHLMDTNTSIQEKSRDMYRESIRVCKEISAVTELEYSLGPQDPLPLFHPYAKMPCDEANRFKDLYQELAAPLRGTDAYLLLEPINRYESPFLNSLDDCIDVVSSIHNPNVGLLPDTFHLSIEEKSVIEALGKSGKLTKHVHLGDNNRLLPGYGNIDWKRCVEVLKASSYSRYLNLECAVPGEPEALLPKTVQYLKNLIKEDMK